MKKSFNKFLIIILLLIIGVGGVAATSIYLGSEILFDKTNTSLSADNIQDAIDEIYERAFKDTCYTTSKTKYTESILNGADPVLGQKMIPVTIDKDGKVTYANVNSPWYEYGQKQWANAVMLIDNPSKLYKECDEIKNDDIKGYFVWIPRYKYKIWDEGNYNSYYQLSNLTDSTTDAATSLRHIANNSRTIEIIFESKSTSASTGSTVGSYLTHPAFTSFNVNGLWVGKFEVGYKGATETSGAQVSSTDSSKIIVKPNVYSWRSNPVANIFEASYNYSRTNDSHMMKNTEWGAAAYLSHSQYGINKEITINNNDQYKTGYGAAANLDQSSYPGTYGNTSAYCTGWNTLNGYSASTTGNITGIYDMSGGALEYMAAYLSGYGVKTSNNVASGFASDPATLKGAKYFDVYNNSTNLWYAYNNRKLGDATGEMGPFYYYYDKDNNNRMHNAWYGDYSYFVDQTYPWFGRGGGYNYGVLAGQFNFSRYTGEAGADRGSRLVLAPNN